MDVQILSCFGHLCGSRKYLVRPNMVGGADKGAADERGLLDAMEQDMFGQLVTRTEFNAEMKLVRQEMASMNPQAMDSTAAMLPRS